MYNESFQKLEQATNRTTTSKLFQVNAYKLLYNVHISDYYKVLSLHDFQTSPISCDMAEQLILKYRNIQTDERMIQIL